MTDILVFYNANVIIYLYVFINDVFETIIKC